MRKTREPLAFANTIFGGYSRAAGGGGDFFLLKYMAPWVAKIDMPKHIKKGEDPSTLSIL